MLELYHIVATQLSCILVTVANRNIEIPKNIYIDIFTTKKLILKNAFVTKGIKFLFTAGVHIADNKIIGMWWNEEAPKNSMHHFVKCALTNIDHQYLTSMHQSHLLLFVIGLLEANV